MKQHANFHLTPLRPKTIRREYVANILYAFLYAYLTCLLLLFCKAAVADCVTPDLSTGLCDRNGDMLADPPEDKKKWINPDPLLIGGTPNTDMTARREQMEPFIHHLEKMLGRKVIFYAARDYSELLAGFRANHVHIVKLNSGSVEQEVRCNGYLPIAQQVDAKGSLNGYQMELIVPVNSPIKTVRDLKNHTVTFVDELSNSGYKVPRNILAKDFGLEADKDYRFDFSGRQDNSVMGVAGGLYETAAIASNIREKLIQDKLLDANALRVIYTSRTFPHSPWGVSHRMDPNLVERIRNAFLAYKEPSGSPLNIGNFRAANYKADWSFMREMSAASGVPIHCKK